MPYEVGQQACCILEICCGGEHQIAELAEWLVEHAGVKKQDAKAVATALLAAWDFAPAGTLRPLKRAIAELARKYPPEPGY